MGLMDSNSFASFIYIVILLYGAANCFFGYKIFKVTLAIVGFILAFLVSYIFTGSFAAAFIIGIIGGAVSFFVYVIGVFFIGALCGFFLPIILALLFSADPSLILAVLFAITGGILAVVFQKLSVILTTAFSGATSIVLSIVLLSNNASLYDAVMYPLFLNYDQTANIFVFILAVAGVLFQYNWRKKKTIVSGGPQLSGIPLKPYQPVVPNPMPMNSYYAEIFCGNCGAKNNAGNAYCLNCGSSIIKK